MTTTPTNPVVKTTALRAYNGWTVREYADGMFDGKHANGSLTTGEATFGDVIGRIRAMEAENAKADAMNAELYRAAFAALGRWPVNEPNLRPFPMSDAERRDRAAAADAIRERYKNA